MKILLSRLIWKNNSKVANFFICYSQLQLKLTFFPISQHDFPDWLFILLIPLIYFIIVSILYDREQFEEESICSKHPGGTAGEENERNKR